MTLRRGACPSLAEPMQTGDGLLVRLAPAHGRLTPSKLAQIAQAADRFGNGLLEITTRGNLQIRGLTAQSAPLLADFIADLDLGITSGLTVETGPLAGLVADEIADPRALAGAIAAQAAELRLAPKVSVTVDGGGALHLGEVSADIKLEALSRGEWHIGIGGTRRTARWLGTGGEAAMLSTSMAILRLLAGKGITARARHLTGHDMAALKAETNIASSSSGLTRGSRPESPFQKSFWLGENGVLRALERSVHKVREHQSAGKRHLQPVRTTFETGSESSHPTIGRIPEPTPPIAATAYPVPVGRFTLCDGTDALGFALPFGQVRAAYLITLCEAAADAGEIRLAPGGGLLVLGLPESAEGALHAAASHLGFITDATDPRLAISACAGAPFCSSAHLDTKALAEEAAGAGLVDSTFRLHVSGCEKRCAQPAGRCVSLIGSEGTFSLAAEGMTPPEHLRTFLVERAEALRSTPSRKTA